MGTSEGSLHDWYQAVDYTLPSSECPAFVDEKPAEVGHNRLQTHASGDPEAPYLSNSSPSQTREQEHRLGDDLTVLQAERVATHTNEVARHPSASLHQSRSRRTEHIDEFDVNTNPVHEKTAVYRPPEHPTSELAKILKKIHNSSFLVRYFMYIIPVAALLSVPLLIGALAYDTDAKGVGGVQLLWFSVWLEIIWLTLWAGRVGVPRAFPLLRATQRSTRLRHVRSPPR